MVRVAVDLLGEGLLLLRLKIDGARSRQIRGKRKINAAGERRHSKSKTTHKSGNSSR